jgi:DNA (cytosine-5)-methyltransferase 1
MRPSWCLFENPPGILTVEDGVAFEGVLSQMEGLGYQVQPYIIPACAVDAKHRRDRIWIVGHIDTTGRKDDKGVPEPTETPRTRAAHCTDSVSFGCDFWQTKPDVGLLVHGIPRGMDPVGALGNAVVPPLVTEIGKMILAVEGAKAVK